MEKSEQVKAEDVVNKLDEDSLGRILWKYGEERLYKKIAHGIVYFRNDHGPIKTTQQLAEIIATVVKQYLLTIFSYIFKIISIFCIVRLYF